MGDADGMIAVTPTGDGVDQLDQLGQRRLSASESWWWYSVGFVSYAALGVWHKWLLNWFVGPVWLIAVVWLGPALVGARRARTRRRIVEVP
jgi:hypothetical protein